MTKPLFKIYSNPIVDYQKINIDLPQTHESTVISLSVHALSGKETHAFKGSLEQIIRLLYQKSQSLDRGVYILALQTGVKIYQQKLVKE